VAEERLLRARDVAAIVGLSETEVWVRSTDGRLPAPVVLGPKYTRWPHSEIQAWVAAQLANGRRLGRKAS
jgi:predicted DNA-binding transcriptional regulator AlpA